MAVKTTTGSYDNTRMFNAKGDAFDEADMKEALKIISYDPHELTATIIEFGIALTGISLYSYQHGFVYRIIYSLITFEGAEPTALFARQTGKSEAVAFIIDTVMVILPALAQVFPELGQFKDGVKIGLYAPQQLQVDTTYERAVSRLRSGNASLVMEELNISQTGERRLALTNGSYCVGQVCSKQSKIESKTWDLIFIDEAQDTNDFVVQKSIEPMKSACVCAGTKLITNTGKWVNVEAVKLHDKILGYGGDGYSVENVSWLKPPTEKACYRITTKMGKTLECSYDHPILFRHRKGGMYGRKTEWRFTEDLRIGNQIGVIEAVSIFGNTPMWEPRVVGWLIGDGTYGANQTPNLSSCDTEIYSYVKHNFDWAYPITPRFTKNGKVYQEIHIKGISKNLRALGIYGQTKSNKRLPTNIFNYNKHSICELLGGFYDTDGYVTLQSGRAGTIGLTSSCKELLDEVRVQLHKLGIHTELIIKKSTEGGYGAVGTPYYNVTISDKRSITTFYECIRFSVQYKQETLTRLINVLRTHKEKIPKDSRGLRYERITNIEFIGYKKVYNLTADNTHTYIANGIVTHNTNGTMVKTGSTGVEKNNFWDSIQYNRKTQRVLVNKDARLQLHFEADYKVVIAAKKAQYKIDGIRSHLNWELDVLKKKAKWAGGENNEAFKLGYSLVWAMESGMFITDTQYDKMTNRRLGAIYELRKEHKDWLICAGLDFGKDINSTVLTIGRSYYEDPNAINYTEPPHKQIMAWIEIQGESYEYVHEVVMNCIAAFNIQILACDYTGVGKGPTDRLMAACGEAVQIIPFTFSKQSKSEGYFNWDSEIKAGRFHVPASKETRATEEYVAFETQLKNLHKSYDGAYMVCHKGDGVDDRDDYCDSGMLFNLAANSDVQEEAEVIEGNLFFGESAGVGFKLSNAQW